jgi:hypothetical protein
MPQSLNRLLLAVLFLLSTAVAVAAAPITISEFSTGGGTLVHDGTGDVSSSDGSAGGEALLMSSFGLTDGSLAADLALLRIQGIALDLNPDPTDPATSASVFTLRLIGLLDGDPLPACPTCAFLDDVNVGSSLTFNPAGNTQNVLFAFDIVGLLSQLVIPSPAFPALPIGLSPEQPQPLGIPFTYALTPDQIAFIVGRMSGFSTGQVRFGLAARVEGVTSTGLDGVRSEFEIFQTPEPAALLLFGAGIAASLRRLRRVQKR